MPFQTHSTSLLSSFTLNYIGIHESSFLDFVKSVFILTYYFYKQVLVNRKSGLISTVEKLLRINFLKKHLQRKSKFNNTCTL